MKLSLSMVRRRPRRKRLQANRELHWTDGTRRLLDASFPAFDPWQKPLFRPGYTVGPPGTGKSTNWALLYNHVLAHHRYGVRERNVNRVCESSIPAVIEAILAHPEARYHLCMLEDAYDAATSGRKGRIPELARMMRIRHLLGRARHELSLPRGALILFQANCQTISGLDKALRDIMLGWQFKFLGGDSASQAITRRYLLNDEQAISYVRGVEQLCQSPNLKDSRLGKASCVWTSSWGGIGSGCTSEIYHHLGDHPWEVEVTREDLLRNEADEQEKRVWELVGDALDVFGYKSDLKLSAYHVYFLATEQDLSEDELKAVRRIHQGLSQLREQEILDQIMPLLPQFLKEQHEQSGEPVPAQQRVTPGDETLGQVIVRLFETHTLSFNVPYSPKVLCKAFPEIAFRTSSPNALSQWLRENQILLETALSCGMRKKQIDTRWHWIWSQKSKDVEAAKARAELAESAEIELVREKLAAGPRFVRV